MSLLSPLRLEAQFDAGPAKIARIGVIVFDEDETTESALAALRASEAGVGTYVARMPVPMGASPEALAKIRRDIAAAAAQLLPSGRLDAAAYACTTSTIELGPDVVAAEIRRGRPDVPVATPITGAVRAFQQAGITRISLLTPYGDRLNRLVIDHLATQGVEVLVCGTFAVADELSFAKVSLDSVRAGAMAVMHPQAEALFICCMALRGTEIAEELGRLVGGRPVVTSAQAMWWEALALAGA